MRHLGILAFTAFAAACSSNSPPPAETAASVEQTSNTSNTDLAVSDTAVANDNLPAASNEHAGSSTPTAGATKAAPATVPAPDTRAVAPSDTSPTNTMATMPPTATAQSDNSRVNSRDKDSKTLTPMDQGGSESDRKITQQIRQSVMKDGSLSFTAKNVKIITINGKVTLRGPVNTAAERSAIEAAAKSAAGATQVDNQLEVKK